MKTKIIVSILLAAFSLFAAQAQMRVHHINVGQGSATLIEFPCAAVLVDTGGEKNGYFDSSNALMTYLEDFFERRRDLNNTIQCLYVTHPHIDHTRAIPLLLQPPYKIKNIVTDGLEKGSGKAQQITLHRTVEAAETSPDTTDNIGFEAVRVNEIGNNGLTNSVIDPINCRGTNPVIKVLWGETVTKPSSWTAKDFDDENNHSLVLRFEYGASSLLIIGDLEDTAQHDLVTKYNNSTLLDTDVYVVGHHGSRNGTTQELLNKVTPKIALIGVGDASRHTAWTAYEYGHPNKDILDMLENSVTGTRENINVQAATTKRTFFNYTITKQIYATGWDDNIVLEADASGHWRKVDMTVPTGSALEVAPSLMGDLAPTAVTMININTASATELETLPGIGVTRAKNIVNYRLTHAKFLTLDDLKKVRGVGNATIDLVKPYVLFND
jgi:competence protein ComEC